MTQSEWKYLKTLQKGRKYEAYSNLPVSYPFWKQTPTLVLTTCLVFLALIKAAIKHQN